MLLCLVTLSPACLEVFQVKVQMGLETAEGQFVSASPQCSDSALLTRLLHTPSLVAGVQRFLSQPTWTLTGEEHCVCVLQGELARVDLQSAPTPACVGSAEATTCVIAIVHSQNPPAVSVAHFDQACLDDASYPAPVDALLEVSPLRHGRFLPTNVHISLSSFC